MFKIEPGRDIDFMLACLGALRARRAGPRAG
jgi:hypothetical protein